MTYWAAHVDFGVVHSLVYPECRDGSGPMVETLQTIVADECFGAVEIAPVPDPGLRKQVRELLQAGSLQVVYLPILPIIFGELSPGLLKVVGEQYGISQDRRCTDYNAMLDSDIDAVIVCPWGSHAPASIAAARKGKHVLIEKPTERVIFAEIWLDGRAVSTTLEYANGARAVCSWVDLPDLQQFTENVDQHVCRNRSATRRSTATCL